MLHLVEFLLLLSGAVGDKAVKCDDLRYSDVCWSSQADDFVDCWQCFISIQKIAASDKELLIHHTLANGTVVDVGHVVFSGDDFPRMPKIIQETTKQPISAVTLLEINTRVLNEEFFGNEGENLTYFVGYVGNKLSLEAFVYQSCASLEVLELGGNKISSIPPDAFVGLHKLIRLELSQNKLSLVNKEWFRDMGNLERLDLSFNELEEIPEDSLAALTKLKRLNLNSNNIEIVSRKTFQHNEQLQFIDLNLNEIKQIQVGTFAHLSQLTQLDLEFNDCIDNNFKNKTLAKIAKALTVCHHSICKIPQIRNGYVINIEDNVTQTPGALLEPFDSVKVVCDPNFIQFHEKVYKCTKKDWMRPLWPTCERACSYEEIIDPNTSTSCKRHGEEVNCAGHLQPGTKATIHCRSGYQKPEGVNSELTCLATGKWSSPTFKCELICGKITSNSTALQVEGNDTNVTDAPWHVGIYLYTVQVCGGTIVSKRVVITAAHCFALNTDTHYRNLKVVAGKYKRGLDEEETLETQIRDVLEVKISKSYTGNNKWWADIATIKIVGHFEYQPHIAPACLQLTDDPAKKYPKDGTSALVAGWGLNKERRDNEILHLYDIPVVDLATCKAEVPVRFKQIIAKDQICAGSVDSKMVCKGDSGDGLVVVQTVNDEWRYFLQGVVTNSYRSRGCDDFIYTMATNVQHYGDFLRESIGKDAAALSSPVTVASRGTSNWWSFTKESFLIEFCLTLFTLTINIVLNL